MNAESSTPNPLSNSHPALQLVSRIDILDTKLHLLELYVSEAQAAAAAESKRLRDQFHAELSALQAEVKQKEANLETHQALAQQADRNQRKQIQELRGELLEANRLAESRQSELTANKLASTALRERIRFLEIEAEKTHVESMRQMASLLEHIKQLESDNEKARNDAAESNEMRVQFELESAALRQELADKSADLASAEAREYANAARYASQTAALQNDVMATKRLLEENQQALEEVKSENRRLHDRIAALNSVHEQAIADAQRAAEARAEEYRQQIAALEQNAVANAELLAQRSQEAAQAQRVQADLQQAIENHAQEAEDARLKLAELQRVQHTLENQLAEAAEAHRRAEQLEQELRSVSAQLAENQQHLDQRNHEVEILQSDLGGSRAQIAQLEEAKWLAGEQYGASLGSLNAQLQKLEAQIAEKEQQIATREREFSALQEHAQQLREQLAHQEHLRQQAADEHSIAIGALQLELRQSSDKNIVARQTVEARDKELSELREGAHHLSMQVAALEHERNQTAADHSAQTQHLEAQLREVVNQLGERQQDLEARERELGTLNDGVHELQRQIAELTQARQRDADEHQSAIASLHHQKSQLETQLEEKQQLIESRENEVTELQESARGLHEQLQRLEQTHQKVVEEQAARVHDLEQGFSARSEELEAALAQRSEVVAQQVAELEAQRGQIGQLDERITQLRQDLEVSCSEKQAVEEQRQTLLRQLEEKQQLIESRENEVTELQESARGLHEQLQRLEQTHQEVVEEQAARVHDLEEGFSARSEELEAALAQRSEVVAQQVAELEAQRGQIGQLDERITQLRQDLEVSCSEKQAVEEQRQTLQRQLEEKQQLIESRENEVTELQESARGLHEQLQRLEQTHQKIVEEQAARVRDLEEGFSARSEELEAALAQRSEVVAQQVAELEAQRGQIGQLDERITQLRQDLEVSYSEKQAVEEQRQTLQHQLADRQRAFEEAQAVLQVKQAELSALHQQAETERYTYAQRATEWERRYHAQESELQRGREELTGLRQHLQTLETTHQEWLQKTAQELAQTRERYASEISALSDEVLHKEAALHNRNAELAASEAHLNGVIQGLNTELSHELQRGQERDQELAQRRAEIEALRSQVTDLEILSTETEHTLAAKIAHLEDTHAKELADLQTQLQEHVQSLAAKESLWLTREANAQAELATLQRSYAEKQALIEQRELAIANLQNQANELAAHCREAEASYNALSEAFNESERRFATEIALRQVAILTLQNELADNQRHAANIERSSSLQINDLQKRLDDNNILLDQRTVRLDELNREIDSLHDQLGALQQTNDQLLNDGTQQKEQFRLRLAELENAVACGAALLDQRLAELERTQAEVSALRQHILTLESLHQSAQTEHQSARAALQDDLGRARLALEQKELDFEVEARSLQAARDQLAVELGTLHACLADRERLLVARESDCAALRADIQALRVQQTDSETATQQAAEAAARSAAEQAQHQAAAQIAEKEALLSKSLAIQEAQRIELAALREQSAELERLQRRCERAEADFQRAERVSAELAALRARLEEKENALRAHEERARVLETSHQESLGNLQVQLAQQQLLAESRARQTEDLRSQIGALQGQLVALENNSRAFAERQQAEFARAEKSLRVELDKLHKQIAEHRTTIEARRVEIGALQNEKVALQGEIERLTAAGVQINSLDAAGNPPTYGDQLLEIANLRAEIVEKQRLLEDRNDKLIHAKGELADLQKSMEGIAPPQDGSQPSAVAATGNDLLWEQLSQNDRVAEQPEPAVVNDRETGFRVTFDRRHNDNLPMPRSAPSITAGPAHGASRNVDPATGEQAQGLEFLLREREGDGRPVPNNGHDRRWRFSLGKKRRWKS